jgi:hypothetical protein
MAVLISFSHAKNLASLSQYSTDLLIQPALLSFVAATHSFQRSFYAASTAVYTLGKTAWVDKLLTAGL